jgi:AcrR family transcriptional regulator
MPYRVTERTEQRRQAMRKRIITAARDLFVRQGYQPTTMQQIVQEAGTSIGNCYFYFSNKEALLQAVTLDFAQVIGQEIDAAVADVPVGSAQLAVALAAGIKAVLSQADLARVLLTETGHPELRSTVLHHFAARLPTFLEHAGLLRSPEEMSLVASAYQGSIFQVVEEAILGTLTADAETLGRFLARWNLQALGIPPEQIERALARLSR